MRRVGYRYFDGETDEERRERYERCEAVAHDLLEYCEQRLIRHPKATREEHLRRILGTLPVGKWVPPEVEMWVLTRTAELLGWEDEWQRLTASDNPRADAN